MMDRVVMAVEVEFEFDAGDGLGEVPGMDVTAAVAECAAVGVTGNAAGVKQSLILLRNRK